MDTPVRVPLLDHFAALSSGSVVGMNERRNKRTSRSRLRRYSASTQNTKSSKQIWRR
jgi:hypothetical protein